MRLTVFGATGRTGQQFVSQASSAGHKITAVVRDPSRFTIPTVGLDIVRADVMDQDAIAPTLDGADAAICCLGPRSRRDTDVAANSARSVIQAMRRTGVRRLVVISAVPVASDDEPGQDLLTRKVAKPLVRKLLGASYPDLVAMEAMIQQSELDWTIMRPPRLTNKPRTGRYRTAVNQIVRGGRNISRADLAHAMLNAVTDPTTVRTTIGIAN